MKESERYLASWSIARDASITLARKAWDRDPENKAISNRQRIEGVIAGTLMKSHGTLSCLLGGATEAVHRWQRAFVCCTTVMVRYCQSLFLSTATAGLMTRRMHGRSLESAGGRPPRCFSGDS